MMHVHCWRCGRYLNDYGNCDVCAKRQYISGDEMYDPKSKEMRRK
jgi:hypothetical protein